MARFQYEGETERPGMIAQMGDLKKIRVPNKDGSVSELLPVPPKTYFVVGEDIGYDITDERSIRVLEADSRYTRLS